MITLQMKDGETRKFSNCHEYWSGRNCSSSDIKVLTIRPTLLEKRNYQHCKAMMEQFTPVAERTIKGWKEDFTIIDRVSWFDHGPDYPFIWICRKYGSHLEHFDITGEDLKMNDNSLEWIKALHDSWRKGNSFEDMESSKWFLYEPYKGIRKISPDEALSKALGFCDMAKREARKY